MILLFHIGYDIGEGDLFSFRGSRLNSLRRVENVQHQNADSCAQEIDSEKCILSLELHRKTAFDVKRMLRDSRRKWPDQQEIPKGSRRKTMMTNRKCNKVIEYGEFEISRR